MLKSISFFMISIFFLQVHASPTREQLDAGRSLLDSPTSPKVNPYKAEGELFAVFALKNKGGRFVVGPYSFYMNSVKHFCLLGSGGGYVKIKDFLPGTTYDGRCDRKPGKHSYSNVFMGTGVYYQNADDGYCWYDSWAKVESLTGLKNGKGFPRVTSMGSGAVYKGVCNPPSTHHWVFDGIDHSGKCDECEFRMAEFCSETAPPPNARACGPATNGFQVSCRKPGTQNDLNKFVCRPK